MGQRCPIGRPLGPFVEIQHPMVFGIRITIGLDTSHVVQLAVHQCEPATTTCLRQQGAAV